VVLFESTNPFFKWNGTNKQGDPVTAGVYYYIATASLKTQVIKPLSGFVELTR
jgi:hypothetical protein